MLDTFQTELLDTLNKIAKDLNRIAAALEKVEQKQMDRSPLAEAIRKR